MYELFQTVEISYEGGDNRKIILKWEATVLVTMESSVCLYTHSLLLLLLVDRDSATCLYLHSMFVIVAGRGLLEAKPNKPV